MKINIPVSVIRNDNHLELDYNSFIVYVKLLELQQMFNSNSIVIYGKQFRESILISDNRTLKKSLTMLLKNGLIKNDVDDISIKGTNVQLNNYADSESLEFNIEYMNHLSDFGVIGMRIFCYLLSYYNTNDDFFNYQLIFSSSVIAERLLLQQSTITKYLKLISKSEFNYLLLEKQNNNVLYYRDNYSKPEKKLKNIKSREKQLELDIIKDLSVIEEGLQFIKNQYHVTEGFIDILARDKNNTLCIIELKVVSNEERLIFQCVYYPTQFNEKVRMITIAPDYDYKIKTALNSIKVEMKTYTYNNDKLIIK